MNRFLSRSIYYRNKIHNQTDLVGESTSDSSSQGFDNYSSRLIKYIPAEVITLQITINAIASSIADILAREIVGWCVFIVGIVGTYLYLYKIQKVRQNKQLALSVGAYIVWVIAIGGPFQTLGWYNSQIAAIILCCYTFLIPVIE